MQKRTIIYILQFAVIYNAIILGWKVTRIDDKRILLSKKVDSFGNINNMNLEHMLSNLIPVA